MRSIVVIYGALFDLGWGRSQNLAKQLSVRGNKVWYVNSVRTARNPLNIFMPRWKKIHSALSMSTPIEGLPSLRFRALKRPDVALQKFQLRKYLGMIGKVDVLLFYGLPRTEIQEWLIEKWSEAAILYDCADAKRETFTDLAGGRVGAKVAEWEDFLLSKVDMAIAVNERVGSDLSARGAREVSIVENGVDLELFHLDKNENKGSNGGLVYAGAINDRMDVDRIKRIVKNSALTLDLYGNHHDVVGDLTQQDGIRYCGEVSYFRLPEILKMYTGALIAYKDLPSIRNSSPLKTLQYLACGLKVYSTNKGLWPQHDRYIIHVQDKIEGDATFDKNDLARYLEKNSWSRKGQEYGEILDSHSGKDAGDTPEVST